MKTHFENLDIYKLFEQLSDQVWKIVMSWEWFEKRSVGLQLVRSADSIGANIAEGSGRYTTKDRLHFMRIARGSLYETKHWLRRAFKRNLLPNENVNVLK